MKALLIALAFIFVCHAAQAGCGAPCNNGSTFVSQGPTIASGFGGTPGISVATNSGGVLEFFITVGSGTPATGVITMPPSPFGGGWGCKATDLTTISTTNTQTVQSGAGTTTSVTLNVYSDIAVAGAWTAADIIDVTCAPR